MENPEYLPFPHLDAPAAPPVAATILGAIGAGARCVRVLPGDAPDPVALHRARLQLDVVAELLERGTHSSSVPATDGLAASSWSIRERGTAIFVTNPTDRTVVGSVFPAIPSIEVAPGHTKVVLLDLAIGPSTNYLSAYAGLVKATVPVLHVDIRPDPHPGARVVICGVPGERTEIVLFHSGRGNAVAVTFEDHPTVIEVDSCLVVAWPDALVPGLCFETDGSVTSGGWRVEADGRVHRWWSAQIVAPADASAHLDPAPALLWIEGRTVDPRDFELVAGPLRFHAAWPGTAEPADVLLLPDGACWALGIDAWSAESEEPRTP
ncbi:MAG: hypothetical protein ACKO5K_00790 [Armatimonadota bacterium]